jgi:hypothetical protein
MASPKRVYFLLLPEAEEAAEAVMAQAVEAEVAAPPLAPPVVLGGQAAAAGLEAKL